MNMIKKGTKIEKKEIKTAFRNQVPANRLKL